MRKDECQTQSKTGEMKTVRGWQGAGLVNKVLYTGWEVERLTAWLCTSTVCRWLFPRYILYPPPPPSAWIRPLVGYWPNISSTWNAIWDLHSLSRTAGSRQHRRSGRSSGPSAGAWTARPDQQTWTTTASINETVLYAGWKKLNTPPKSMNTNRCKNLRFEFEITIKFNI